MGRTPYIDVDGAERRPSGRISETETVWTALQLLFAAARAPVPSGGDRPLSTYLNIEVEAVGNPIFPFPAQYGDFLQNHTAGAKAALEAEFAVLDRSGTFRQLVRAAVHAGRLGAGADRRWTVRVVPPMGFRNGLAVFRTGFAPDNERRTLVLPSIESPLMAGRYYLAPQGTVTAVGASCITMQAVVAMLTGMGPRLHAAWLDGAGDVDPRRIRELGAGERGAVTYLVQRIIRELFPGEVVWLSSLPFGDGNLGVGPHPVSGVGRLNRETQRALDDIGGVAEVARYVSWQDRYLEHRCPLAEAAPIPGPIPGRVVGPTPSPIPGAIPGPIPGPIPAPRRKPGG
jgi:hypothetical protein